MAEIFPQPSGVSLIQNAGPVYAMIADADETASLYFTATSAIAVNDLLVFSGKVLTFSGEPIEVKHGAHLVGTIEAAGTFSFQRTATTTSNSLRFISGGEPGSGANHLMAGLSVQK